jgi:hypothetical protein
MSDPQFVTEPIFVAGAKPVSSGLAPELPPELERWRWNWGAFLLNWIWGIGNNTYVALLTLVPPLFLIMPFVLGAKGNRWAWRNGRWDNVAHFRRVQRNWAIAGVAAWIGGITLFGGIAGGVLAILKHSEAYKLGVAQLATNPIAANLLGTPITTGNPAGKIQVTPAGGTAMLTFSASGPRAAGTVYLSAVKQDGRWSLTRMTLKLNGSDSSIDLIGRPNNST